jgi:ubiquinone/menaquinone biosynthesis C-methylase UbiE
MTGAPIKPGRYRSIASVYDLLFGSVNRPLSRAGVALSRPRAGMRVLDVCCGTGSHLEGFQGHQCVLFGLDASPSMLVVAQGRLGEAAHLDRGDATRLPYARGAFDIVGCKLALHEMPAGVRASVLGEARRVLKPGGRIVLVDFHPGPYEQLKGWITRAVIVGVEFIAGWEHFKNHRQFLASGGLRALAKEQGLQVEMQVLLGGGNFAVQCLVNAASVGSAGPGAGHESP